MDTSNTYAVYFEGPWLDKQNKKSIETYFKIRRKSGGGECGPLEVLDEKVYRIAFKYQKDQRRVLEKREHSLELEGRPSLRFTIHENLQSISEGPVSIPTHTQEADSPKLGLTTSVKFPIQLPVLVPPSPTVGAEHGVQSEANLPGSLNASLAVRMEREKEVSSIGDHVQIRPAEGSATVRGSLQPDPDGVGLKWKERVEKIFDIKEDADEVGGHVQGGLGGKVLPPSQNPGWAARASSENARESQESTDRIARLPASQAQPHPGKEEMQSDALSHWGVTQLDDRRHDATKDEEVAPALGVAPRGKGVVQSYLLSGGAQVLVCHGDITKERADALVNAANRHLHHGGGVAAALSDAAGPVVQRESTALVQRRSLSVGDAVMTSGGNLSCKKLIHVVGPAQGDFSGNENLLLQRSVRAALDLAEESGFRSIALPCISSGIFGIPISVCTEAIVAAVGEFGRRQRCLKTITLIDNREEVVEAMQKSCDRLLRGPAEESPFQGNSGASAPRPGPRPPNDGAPLQPVKLEVAPGSIELQEVDAIVLPMMNHDPWSTSLGATLSETLGTKLEAAFRKEGGTNALPVEVDAEGVSGLRCGRVFFVNLLPWDNEGEGAAVRALKQGLCNVLASCKNQGLASVALPMLGTGQVLRFPHRVAAEVLSQEIREHPSSRRPLVIRVLVHPSDKETIKIFQSSQEVSSPAGFPYSADTARAFFYQCVSSTSHEVTAMVGSVELKLVSGDIVREKTDVIVNTTNFTTYESGVSRAILMAAGEHVNAEFLKRVYRGGKPGEANILVTGAGALGCKAIYHVTFYQSVTEICRHILQSCEERRHRSVSFPAVATGVGGMDYKQACNAMLAAVEQFVKEGSPNVLSLIRIVIMDANVFQAFRSVLENRFGQIVLQSGLHAKPKTSY